MWRVSYQVIGGILLYVQLMSVEWNACDRYRKDSLANLETSKPFTADEGSSIIHPQPERYTAVDMTT